MVSSSFATAQAFAARPTVRRPMRAVITRAALPQRQVVAQPLKTGAASLAAALLLTENNERLFERNLGEGRKLVPEPDQVKDVGSRLPAPLPFRKAERATPDMKFEGGDKPLPGIAKSIAKDSVAAPLTESQS